MRSIAVLAVVVSALVLVAVSSATAQEETDIEILLPTEEFDIFEEEKPSPCCDRCVCTRSRPPQCQCTDVTVGHCHPGCKKCICTRSIPAKCRCHDIKSRCDPHCRSE